MNRKNHSNEFDSKEYRSQRSSKRRRKSGDGLLVAAVLLTIVFFAGTLSLCALYYLERDEEPQVNIPEAISSAADGESLSGYGAGTDAATETADVFASAADETKTDISREAEPAGTVDASKTDSVSAASADVSEAEPVSSEQTGDTDSEESSESGKTMLAKQAVLRNYTNLGMITGVRNYLNIRSGPSTAYDMCGVIFKNCAVEILEENNSGWMKIESGGAVGYVSSAYVTTGEDARQLALENMRYMAKVLTDSADALNEPDDDSEVVTTLLKGEKYNILGEDGDWVEVEAVEGLSCYVESDKIYKGYFLDEAIIFSFDGVSEKRQDLIRMAFDYYGGTYYWGGKELTADGNVDCSGFTMCLYRKFGVELPEFSGAQAEIGETVDESTIRPGDLIFYVGRYPGVIGHVAIYIGNEKIIHAASESKGICVSNWKFVPPVTMKNVFED